ncbi:uncharacterized protein LOC117784375 [Drosophila innubila]|uniref:uncharacterized protein LOC117784375 n=1 Tax=Drosophila innubila TaxID=198719 RepID=UPI00148C2C88|nr:uncharacterized protein LOC117784375 [Drosophila innubila]
MFPLCCRPLRNNLKLACLYIGLIELALCVGRFGIFIDHLSINRESMTYTILSLPILVLTLESIFFIQLLSAVMITVGADLHSNGFLIAFLVLSFITVIFFIPVMIVCGVYASYQMLFAWLVLLAPELYFWIVVIYYMQYLRAVELSAANGEYGSTEV